MPVKSLLVTTPAERNTKRLATNVTIILMCRLRFHFPAAIVFVEVHIMLLLKIDRVKTECMPLLAFASRCRCLEYIFIICVTWR